MTSSSDTSLSLEAVVSRFSESETLLNQLREQLQALIAEHGGVAAAGTALDRSAESANRFSSAAGELLAEMHGAVEQARGVLQAGQTMLDGTALADLQASVQRMETAQSELTSAQASISEAQQASLNDLQSKLAVMTVALTALDEIESSLARNREAVGSGFLSVAAQVSSVRSTLIVFGILTLAAQAGLAALFLIR